MMLATNLIAESASWPAQVMKLPVDRFTNKIACTARSFTCLSVPRTSI